MTGANQWTRLEHRIREAYETLWSDVVDPAEPYWDEGGGWLPLGGGAGRGASGVDLALSATRLTEIRNQSRCLALENEFAINALENRISYIVGAGHAYEVVARKGSDVSPDLIEGAQRAIDEFLLENDWSHRQQEIVRRYDRDGEVFLRFFPDPSGMVRVRFVEPEQVATPSARAADPAASLGIATEPDDVETVLAYFVDGRSVAAAEIQHRKANVDGTARRGLPLLHPVRKNLRRAEKLLRNMSVLAEVQSAIALIRKHRSASRAGVEQFVASQADASHTDASGRTQHVRRFGPGAILDAPAGLEYDFPAAAVDAGNFVAILQAELRAVASRLVMPEFMLTSDASNANYSSTLVAEGPAVKMFGRMQATHIAFDRKVMRRVLAHAAATGQLPTDALDALHVQVVAPTLATRDLRDEVEIDRIAHAAGVLSRKTWGQRLGLDYEQERRNMADE
jgi:capsid protein